jgi:hypothetical protein
METKNTAETVSLGGGEKRLRYESANSYLSLSPAKSKLNKHERIRRNQLGDVKYLMSWRWGNPLREGDEGAFGDLEILLHFLATHGLEVLLRTIEIRAPWMPEDQAQRLAEKALGLPWPNRETLRALRVTWEEIVEHKLWHIPPIDLTEEELAARRRERKNAKQRERRNRTPRPIYLASVRKGGKATVLGNAPVLGDGGVKQEQRSTHTRRTCAEKITREKKDRGVGANTNPHTISFLRVKSSESVSGAIGMKPPLKSLRASHPSPNEASPNSYSRNARWRQKNPDAYRASQQELMRKRRAAAKEKEKWTLRR